MFENRFHKHGPQHFNLLRSAVLILIAGVVSGCQSVNKSQVSVDYYQISGNSTAVLDREIRRKGPVIEGGHHAVAVARIKMIPNVEFSFKAGLCSITKAKVAVRAKVTLPAWSGRKTASKKLGQAWDNIDRYTRAHESVHVAIAFRFAQDIEAQLLASKPQANCQAARHLGQKIIDETLAAHDVAQKQFDADEQQRLADNNKTS